MARIVGVDIPNDKVVVIALTYIYVTFFFIELYLLN